MTGSMVIIECCQLCFNPYRRHEVKHIWKYGDASWDCSKMFNPKKRDLHAVLKQWSGILKDMIFT